MKRIAAALALAAALAGCGGSAKPPAAAKPPRLPRALAHFWASQATAVAQALQAGDGCTAQQHANELRAAVDNAAGEVPARLRAQLVATVDALPGRITCNPAPPSEKEHHDHGHHNGDHNGNGQGNEG